MAPPLPPRPEPRQEKRQKFVSQNKRPDWENNVKKRTNDVKTNNNSSNVKNTFLPPTAPAPGPGNHKNTFLPPTAPAPGPANHRNTFLPPGAPAPGPMRKAKPNGVLEWFWFHKWKLLFLVIMVIGVSVGILMRNKGIKKSPNVNSANQDIASPDTIINYHNYVSPNPVTQTGTITNTTTPGSNNNNTPVVIDDSIIVPVDDTISPLQSVTTSPLSIVRTELDIGSVRRVWYFDKLQQYWVASYSGNGGNGGNSLRILNTNGGLIQTIPMQNCMVYEVVFLPHEISPYYLAMVSVALSYEYMIDFNTNQPIFEPCDIPMVGILYSCHYSNSSTWVDRGKYAAIPERILGVDGLQYIVKPNEYQGSFGDVMCSSIIDGSVVNETIENIFVLIRGSEYSPETHKGVIYAYRVVYITADQHMATRRTDVIHDIRLDLIQKIVDPKIILVLNNTTLKYVYPSQDRNAYHYGFGSSMSINGTNVMVGNPSGDFESTLLLPGTQLAMPQGYIMGFYYNRETEQFKTSVSGTDSYMFKGRITDLYGHAGFGFMVNFLNDSYLCVSCASIAYLFIYEIQDNSIPLLMTIVDMTRLFPQPTWPGQPWERSDWVFERHLISSVMNGYYIIRIGKAQNQSRLTLRWEELRKTNIILPSTSFNGPMYIFFWQSPFEKSSQTINNIFGTFVQCDSISITRNSTVRPAIPYNLPMVDFGEDWCNSSTIDPSTNKLYKYVITKSRQRHYSALTF